MRIILFKRSLRAADLAGLDLGSIAVPAIEWLADAAMHRFGAPLPERGKRRRVRKMLQPLLQAGYGPDDNGRRALSMAFGGPTGKRSVAAGSSLTGALAEMRWIRPKLDRQARRAAKQASRIRQSNWLPLPLWRSCADLALLGPGVETWRQAIRLYAWRTFVTDGRSCLDLPRTGGTLWRLIALEASLADSSYKEFLSASELTALMRIAGRIAATESKPDPMDQVLAGEFVILTMAREGPEIKGILSPLKLLAAPRYRNTTGVEIVFDSTAVDHSLLPEWLRPYLEQPFTPPIQKSLSNV